MKTAIVNIQKPFEITTDRQKNIIKWDLDNGYPQRYMWFAQKSVTALSCIDLFSKFLFGEGWTDRLFGEAKLGFELTGDDLGELIFQEWAQHRGYAILVGVNGLLEHSSYQIIPFERVRKGDNQRKGQFGTHEHWGITGKRFQTSDIEWFEPYSEDKDTLMGYIEKAEGFENFKGMILYVSIDPLNYPTPKYVAALDSAETEGQAATFKRRNVTTGFMASHIFKFSEEFETDEARNQMMEFLQTFQGAQEGSKILMMEGVDEDDGMNLDIEEVVIQDVDRLFEFTETSSADAIRKTFLAPKSLIGQEESTGFDTERIPKSRAYYNSVVIWDRNKAIKPFAKIVHLFETPVKTSNDWSVKELFSDEKLEDDTDNQE